MTQVVLFLMKVSMWCSVIFWSILKGKFILSYNDCSFIRGLYDGFKIENVSQQNNLALPNGKDKVYRELIIKNF